MDRGSTRVAGPRCVREHQAIPQSAPAPLCYCPFDRVVVPAASPDSHRAAAINSPASDVRKPTASADARSRGRAKTGPRPPHRACPSGYTSLRCARAELTTLETGSVQQGPVSHQNTTYSPHIATPPTTPAINLQPPAQAPPASNTRGTPIDTRPTQPRFESLVSPSQPPPPPVIPQDQPSMPQPFPAGKPQSGTVPTQSFTAINTMSRNEAAAPSKVSNAKQQWTSVPPMPKQGLPVQRTQSAPSHHPPVPPPPTANPVYRGELYKVVSGLSSPISRLATAAGEYPPHGPGNEGQQVTQSRYLSLPPNVSAPPQAVSTNVLDPPRLMDPLSELSIPASVSPSSPEETLPVIRPPRTVVSKHALTATKTQPQPPVNPPAPAPIQSLQQKHALPISNIPDLTKPSVPQASTDVNNTSAIVSALFVIRGPLNSRESEAISRIISLGFHDENLFKALVLERIVQQNQLPRLKTVYDLYKDAPSATQSTTTTTLFQSVQTSKPIANPPATSISTTKHNTVQPLQQPPKIDLPPALGNVSTSLSSSALPKSPSNRTLTPSDRWILETMREYAQATGRPHHIGIINRFVKSAPSPIGASVPDLMISSNLWHEQDLREFKAFGKLKSGQTQQATGNVAAGDLGRMTTMSSGPTPALSNRNVLSSSSYSTTNVPAANIPKRSAEKKTRTEKKANGQLTPADLQTTAGRARKLTHQKIALAIPETRSQLLATINSWPRDQIARNVLIAAGRVIPGEESKPRYNQEYEPLREKIKSLKFAELSTIDWDVIDPPLGPGEGRDLRMLGGSVKRPIETSDLGGTSAMSGVASSSVPDAAHYGNFIGKPLLGPIPSTTSLIKSTQYPLPTTISSSQSGTSMLVRNGPGNSHRHASAIVSKPPIPSPATPTKPVAQSPNRPPSEKKLTPQVVIITPRKSRVTPPAAIVRDDRNDVTPTKPALAKRPAPSSSTASLVGRTPKRARTTSETIGLTKSNNNEPFLLDPGGDSDDESQNKFTLSPSKRKSGKTASAFTSIACRWKECSADLHSFETLEQHVLKVHGKPPKTKVFQCLWDDCPNSKKGVREYHDREEWEYHVNRMHLQPLKHSCPVQGGSPPFSRPSLIGKGCGQRFASKEGLDEHALSVHSSGVTNGVGRKRKASDGQSVTPIIQPMPPELARKQRAGYDGPSRSFGIGQNRRR